MSKKDTSTKVKRKNITQILAFWAFVVAVIIYLIDILLERFGISVSVLEWIESAAKTLLYAVAALHGYGYVKTKSTPWQVLYIVLVLVVVILGLPIF